MGKCMNEQTKYKCIKEEKWMKMEFHEKCIFKRGELNENKSIKMNEWIEKEKCKDEQTKGGEMNENGKMYEKWMNVLKGKWINKQCTYIEEMGNDCIKREGGRLYEWVGFEISLSNQYIYTDDYRILAPHC